MSVRREGIFIAVLGALLSGCVSAPKNQSIPAEGRSIVGGREVQISVAQGEIKTNINASNMTAAAGGGLLFALVDAGVESHRAGVAEQVAKPLRDALVGYDFDARAQERTKATLAELDWFAPRDYSFVKEINADARSAKLDAMASSQMAFVDYEYSLTPDFGAVEISVTVSLANKQAAPGQKPVTRLSAANLAYHQQSEVLIPLNNASKRKEENADRWAGNGAALAKQALDTGLTRVQAVIKRGLTQSANDLSALDQGMRHGKPTVAGGISGLLVETSNAGTLLWLGDPVYRLVLVTEPVG